MWPMLYDIFVLWQAALAYKANNVGLHNISAGRVGA
jgi:hypothetical protein